MLEDDDDNRVGQMMRHHTRMNRLLDLNLAPGEEVSYPQEEEDLPPKEKETDEGEKGSGGRRSSGGSGSLYLRSLIRDILVRHQRDRDDKASVIGLIQPSDGHPQEELTPDFGWFRPLAHNNTTWVLYWPELTV